MQYMLLIDDQPNLWADLPEAQRAELSKEYMQFTQGIVRSGHFRAGDKLKPTAIATTVREKEGKRIATDGPFAESKEQLGGYHLVECQDLDEALAIAGRIPTLGVGGAIEVRPVLPPSER